LVSRKQHLFSAKNRWSHRDRFFFHYHLVAILLFLLNRNNANAVGVRFTPGIRLEFPSLACRLIWRSLALWIAAGLTPVLWAGFFFSDFTTGNFGGPSPTLYGSAQLIPQQETVTNGYLRLTSALQYQQGAFILPALDSNTPIVGFTATFKVRLGGGTPTPADGFSFNFAGDLPAASFSEEGAGTGLTVSFDTFNNGGGEAPAIEVRFGNVLLARNPVNISLLQTGSNFTTVEIILSDIGKLRVRISGQDILQDVSGYSARAGRFGLGARTGFYTDNHWIDDLSITTTPASGPNPISLSPVGRHAPWRPLIAAALEDYNGRTVVTNGITLLIDGVALAPQVVKTGAVTFVSYVVPSNLQPGSQHEVRLTYRDNFGQTRTNEWSFVVAAAEKTITLFRGYTVIGNPFRKDGDTLDEVVTGVPAGTTVFKYDSAANGFTSSVYFDRIGWEPNFVVPAGVGLFIEVKAQTNLTFTGDPLRSDFSLAIPPGFSLVSSISSTRTGGITTDLDFPPEEGDRVYKWRQATTSYITFLFNALDQKWESTASPQEPQIGVGEGFFLYLPTEARTWSLLPRGAPKIADSDFKKYSAGSDVIGKGTVRFCNDNDQGLVQIFPLGGLYPGRAQLWAGPNESSLAPVEYEDEEASSPRNIRGRGFFNGGVVPLNNVAVGSPVYLQIRAWGNTDATYDQAAHTPNELIFHSNVFPYTTGGKASALANAYPPSVMTNLQAFKILPVLIWMPPTHVKFGRPFSELKTANATTTTAIGITPADGVYEYRLSSGPVIANDQVLSVGTHNIWVTFMPNPNVSGIFLPASVSATIRVLEEPRFVTSETKMIGTDTLFLLLQGTDGVPMAIESSEDLINWATHSFATTSNGQAQLNLNIPQGQSIKYFRVKIPRDP
jgi:hypothetical protein